MYPYPVSPSGDTVVQSHSQDIDIDTVKVQNISITKDHVSLLQPSPLPSCPHLLLNPWQLLVITSIILSFQECYIY